MSIQSLLISTPIPVRLLKWHPIRVPPTPQNGSSTKSPSFVKVLIKDSHNSGGFCPPCLFLSLSWKLGGYPFGITDLVEKTHSFPVKSLS